MNNVPRHTQGAPPLHGGHPLITWAAMQALPAWQRELWASEMLDLAAGRLHDAAQFAGTIAHQIEDSGASGHTADNGDLEFVKDYLEVPPSFEASTRLSAPGGPSTSR